MKTIDLIRRDIGRIFDAYFLIYAGIVHVPEEQRESLLRSYEACEQNAKQMIANLREAERLIQNWEALN